METGTTITCTGTIIKELPSVFGKTPDGRTWEKTSYVMLVDGYREDKIKLDTMSFDGPSIKIEVGTRVQVEASVTSREYNGTWFTNITAKRIYDPS